MAESPKEFGRTIMGSHLVWKTADRLAARPLRHKAGDRQGEAALTQKRFVSIGECMIEMAGGEDRQYRLGYAGDTLNTAWYTRALLRR